MEGLPRSSPPVELLAFPGRRDGQVDALTQGGNVAGAWRRVNATDIATGGSVSATNSGFAEE